MTVKGLHYNNFKQKELDESLNSQPIKYNGANSSPHINLNHYKSNQVNIFCCYIVYHYDF